MDFQNPDLTSTDSDDCSVSSRVFDLRQVELDSLHSYLKSLKDSQKVIEEVIRLLPVPALTPVGTSKIFANSYQRFFLRRDMSVPVKIKHQSLPDVYSFESDSFNEITDHLVHLIQNKRVALVKQRLRQKLKLRRAETKEASELTEAELEDI